MKLDWQYNNRLRDHIRCHLQKFDRVEQSDADKIQAAVALVVTNVGTTPLIFDIRKAEAQDAAVILTRRSEKLGSHAGQWALPGGRIEEGENAEQAALRELSEEVDLHLESDSVLGMLDDFTTRSGYTITPVVIWGGKNPKLNANPSEVDSIHRIPVTEFLREDAPYLKSIPESDEPVLLMPVGQGWIATPTGAILYQFREVALNNRNTRVSHYEQPYFAWQ